MVKYNYEKSKGIIKIIHNFFQNRLIHIWWWICYDFYNRKGIVQYYNIARKISVEYEYGLSNSCFGFLTLKPGHKIKLFLS